MRKALEGGGGAKISPADQQPVADGYFLNWL